MRKVFIIASVFIAFVYISISCSKGGSGAVSLVDCNTVTNKAFAADVNPIIQSSCAITGCHDAGSGNGVGQLTTYNDIFNHRTEIQSAVSAGRMPKTGSISTSQKNSILCWIQSGAPNN